MADTGSPSNTINTATYTSGAQVKAADHTVPHADIKAKFEAHTHSLPAGLWESVHGSQEWVMVSGTSTGTASAAGVVIGSITIATDADQGDPSILADGNGLASMHIMFSVRVPTESSVYFVGYAFASSTTVFTLRGQLVYSNAGTIETKASALGYEVDWILVGRQT